MVSFKLDCMLSALLNSFRWEEKQDTKIKPIKRLQFLLTVLTVDENPYNGYRKTDRAFIYSLHNKEGLAPFKSMVKHDSQAIFMDISHGPTFGGGFDIHIANNAGHNVHSYTNFGHSFLAPSDVEEKDTVLAGTYYFTPDEVEVFYLP